MPDLGLTDSLGSAENQSQGWGAQIGNILSHPLVQAALATYLGAISSPRRLGWGGAIGRGGLMGLGQFGAAEQLQAEQPRLQAQTALYQAEAENYKRKNAVRQQYLDWLDNDPAAKKMDPTQREVLRYAISSGTALPPETFGMSPYHKGELEISKQKEDIEAEKAKAAEKESAIHGRQLEAEMGTYRGLEKEREAAAARSMAGVGAERTAELVNRAKLAGTLPAEPRPVAPGAYVPDASAPGGYRQVGTPTAKPEGASLVRSRAEKEAEDAAKSYWWASGDKREAFKQKKIQEYMRTHADEVGGGPSPAPIPSATSLSGRPIYTWRDGTHHYNPEAG